MQCLRLQFCPFWTPCRRHKPWWLVAYVEPTSFPKQLSNVTTYNDAKILHSVFWLHKKCVCCVSNTQHTQHKTTRRQELVMMHFLYENTNTQTLPDVCVWVYICLTSLRCYSKCLYIFLYIQTVSRKSIWMQQLHFRTSYFSIPIFANMQTV